MLGGPPMGVTRGAGASWALLGGLLLAAVAQPWGCKAPGGPETPADEAISDILVDAWPLVLEPTLQRARAEADALQIAVEDWAATGGGSGPALDDARAAWLSAMDAWQEAEVMQVGPAGSSVVPVIGGRDLRDEIYSWTAVNRCRVDQETVKGGWESPDFFQVSLVNAYGLDALETLLFSGPSNACPPQVDINSTGSWDALGAAGVAQRRADYAVVVVGGVVDTLDELVQAWSPDGEDFAGQLATAGEEGSPYVSRSQAINAIYDALFYLELRTKDRKLAPPLGLRADCSGDGCFSDVESRIAGASHLWIRANLRGFRELYLGGDGVGMDDLVRALGHDDVADRMIAAIDDALLAADALDIPIDEAATSDLDAGLAVHDAVKGITDILKNELPTLLTLEIPVEGGGDND